MKKLSRWRSPGRQKSMCFAAQGRLQGRAAKLLLARRKSWYSADLLAICLTANGPAIKCVCVAERMKAGAVSPHRGRALVPAGMSEAWRGFWRHCTNFRAHTSVAV